MTCDCGNQMAYRVRYSMSGGMSCDSCGGLSSVHFPDVYFKERYLDPHLIDVHKPEQKDGVWIESRAQKAELMRTLGVREAGDKRHGSRPDDKIAQRRERENGFGVRRNK